MKKNQSHNVKILHIFVAKPAQRERQKIFNLPFQSPQLMSVQLEDSSKGGGGGDPRNGIPRGWQDMKLSKFPKKNLYEIENSLVTRGSPRSTNDMYKCQCQVKLNNNAIIIAINEAAKVLATGLSNGT